MQNADALHTHTGMPPYIEVGTCTIIIIETLIGIYICIFFLYSHIYFINIVVYLRPIGVICNYNIDQILTKYTPSKKLLFVKHQRPAAIYIPYLITLYTDLKMNTVREEAITFYKRFHSKFTSHFNPLISDLVTLTILGDHQRRLKRKCIYHLAIC